MSNVNGLKKKRDELELYLVITLIRFSFDGKGAQRRTNNEYQDDGSKPEARDKKVARRRTTTNP